MPRWSLTEIVFREGISGTFERGFPQACTKHLCATNSHSCCQNFLLVHAAFQLRETSSVKFPSRQMFCVFLGIEFKLDLPHCLLAVNLLQEFTLRCLVTIAWAFAAYRPRSQNPTRIAELIEVTFGTWPIWRFITGNSNWTRQIQTHMVP